MEIDKRIVGYKAVTDTPDQPDLPLPREETLAGVTWGFDIDTLDYPLYVTLNLLDGKPYEIFINCVDSKVLEWSQITTRLLSAIFRQGGDSSFVWEELEQMFWIEPFFYKGKQYYSILAVIGERVKGYLDETK